MAEERFSFAEFVRRKNMKLGIARGFQADLRTRGKTFDYRTAAEWDGELSLFHATDRRRHS
ncbi:MAG: hypothetical protein ABI629_10435 [bacterium]